MNEFVSDVLDVRLGLAAIKQCPIRHAIFVGHEQHAFCGPCQYEVEYGVDPQGLSNQNAASLVVLLVSSGQLPEQHGIVLGPWRPPSSYFQIDIRSIIRQAAIQR